MVTIRLCGRKKILLLLPGIRFDLRGRLHGSPNRLTRRAALAIVHAVHTSVVSNVRFMFFLRFSCADLSGQQIYDRKGREGWLIFLCRLEVSNENIKGIVLLWPGMCDVRLPLEKHGSIAGNYDQFVK